MAYRLLKCLKAWGAGILIMGFPLVFLYSRFSIGTAFWRIPLAVFFIYFPFLLFFEFIILPYLKISGYLRIIILAFLFIASEVEFYFLPYDITQLTFHPDALSVLILLFSIFIAAFTVSKIMTPGSSLIIIQKEL